MAVSDRRLWQLEGDLRQAFENYFGGAQVSGAWDKLITELAEMVNDGALNLERAARLNLLLASTGETPDTCAVCECPYPDQAHR